MITLFAADATDFSTNGLAILDGACLSAEITEDLNGEYGLDVEIRADSGIEIDVGMVLRAPAPTRPSIELRNVETHKVYETTTSAPMKTNASYAKGSVLRTLKAGTRVVWTRTSDNGSWYKCTTMAGAEGWIEVSKLAYVGEESAEAEGYQVVPEQSADQLFRIGSVSHTLESVTIHADHIFYDLAGNYVKALELNSVSGGSALADLLGACLMDHDFEGYSDVTGTATISASRRNPVDVLLAEDGFRQYNAQLLRDNFNIYLMSRVGENRGALISYRKNITGMSVDVDMSTLVTHVIPIGYWLSGDPMYLVPDPVVASPRAGDYPVRRVAEIDCREVKKGPDYHDEVAVRAELRRRADAYFEAGADLPTVTVDVDYVHAPSAVTDAMRCIYLGDTVTFRHEVYGFDMPLQVTGYIWDALNRRYTALTLSSKNPATAGIRVNKNLIPLNAIAGRQIAPNSITEPILSNQAVTRDKIADEAVEGAHVKANTLTTNHVSAGFGAELNLTGNAIRAEVTDEIANAVSSKANTSDLEDYVSTINGALGVLQSQIDGSITTWFYNVPPTAGNAPANGWTTTEEKNRHLGDLYYDTNTGYCYRWQIAEDVYSWLRITDTDVTKALSDAAKAQDTADGKRRVFVTTPTPPYDVGDLWAQGASGDLMRCKTAKATGASYSSADWEPATKYTDDSALVNYSTIEQTASAITAAVGSVKVGGRNYIRNSALMENADGWILQTSVTRDASYSLNGAYCIKSFQVGRDTDTLYGARLAPDNRMSVVVGDIFTASVWVRVDDASTFDKALGLTAEVYNSSGSRVEFSSTTFQPDPANNGKWLKLVATMTVTSADGVYASMYFRITRNGIAWFACPKLERGNKDTDWGSADDEFIAGSEVSITKDAVRINTPFFEVGQGGNQYMSLDSSGGYFPKLTSPQAIPRYDGPAALTVNSATDPDGVTYFSTLYDAVAVLRGRWLDSAVTITVADTYADYNPIDIVGIYGGGSITIDGDGKLTVYNAVRVANCGVPVTLDGIKAKHNASPLSIFACAYVLVQDCVFETTGGVAVISVDGGATVRITGTTMAAGNFSMRAYRGSRVTMQDCTGDKNICSEAAFVSGYGTMPSGSSGSVTTTAYQNGYISGTGGTTVSQGTGAGTIPSAPATGDTTELYVTETAWHQGGLWCDITQIGYVRQGYTGYGQITGCMWFDMSSLAGKSAAGVKLRLTRSAGYGFSEAVSVRVMGLGTACTGRGTTMTRTTDYGTVGKILPGETKEFTLPNAAGDALINGTIGGLCVFVSDAAKAPGYLWSTNYAQFMGTSGTDDTKPKLTVYT